MNGVNVHIYLGCCHDKNNKGWNNKEVDVDGWEIIFEDKEFCCITPIIYIDGKYRFDITSSKIQCKRDIIVKNDAYLSFYDSTKSINDLIPILRKRNMDESYNCYYPTVSRAWTFIYYTLIFLGLPSKYNIYKELTTYMTDIFGKKEHESQCCVKLISIVILISLPIMLAYVIN
jgi:hypothetical protein